MDTLKAIRKRCSIRRYKPRPLTRKQIEKVVDAGRLAPTAWGKQPWEFIVVTDPETKNRIADMTDYGKFIKKAHACIAVFCEDTQFYLEDGCAATENILIAATALGLGTCWVAGDKKNYADSVREILEVPSSHKLISLIPIGYAEWTPGQKWKRALRNVLHWEKYKSP